MKRPTIVVAALAAALAGCATPTEPTHYAKADNPRGPSYGYRDKQVGDDEYSIVATGNRMTTKERVAEIALLRAARITQEHGRTHFVIFKREARDLKRFENESIFIPIGGIMTWVPVGEHSATEPMSVLLIRLLPLHADYPQDAIDAARVIEHLAPRVE